MKSLFLVVAGLVLLALLNPTYDQFYNWQAVAVVAGLVVGAGMVIVGICAGVGALATRCRS